MWGDIADLIIKSLCSVQPVLRNNYRSVLPPDNDGFRCGRRRRVVVLMCSGTGGAGQTQGWAGQGWAELGWTGLGWAVAGLRSAGGRDLVVDQIPLSHYLHFFSCVRAAALRSWATT